MSLQRMPITPATFRRLKAASLRGGLVLDLLPEQVEQALRYRLIEQDGNELRITPAGRTAWAEREALGEYDLASIISAEDA
jgi:hypothetical protein